jgi:undecaprenyl-diphosphatase
MQIIQSIILGIVQGASEFIPVSSSGHLLVARKLLGMPLEGGLAFDAVLQLATAGALVVYFRKDIMQLIVSFIALIRRKKVETDQKTLLWAIILGSIPAVIFGLMLEKTMDTIFRNIHLVAYALIAGSFLFYTAERWGSQVKKLTIFRGVGIGLFQCLALIPGVSRSGATISGGLFFGLTRSDASRFSFLLSAPILIGSGLKKLFEIIKIGELHSVGIDLLCGSAVAFIVGYFAIDFLITYLKKNTLTVFIVYRVLFAFALLFFM